MASKDKIFLDTDVVLDHLANRQPFAEYAHRLFALAETGEHTVCVSSLSFSNLYYLLRKLKGHSEAMVLLGKLRQLVRVSTVAESEIQLALSSKFKDFEDAIQHFSAKAEGASVLVTRNKSDYSASEIPVLSPEEYLAQCDPARGMIAEEMNAKIRNALSDKAVLWEKGEVTVHGGGGHSSEPCGDAFEGEVFKGDLSGCRLIVDRIEASGKVAFNASIVTSKGQMILGQELGKEVWNAAANALREGRSSEL